MAKNLFLSLLILITAACVGPTPKPARAPTPAPAPQATRHTLETVLADYRSLAAKGGWGFIPDGPPLVLGDTGDRIAELRKRLIVTRDLAKGKDSNVFDSADDEALRRFQTRHGLEPDGTLNKETLSALNVPVEERIRQLEVSRARLQGELAGKFGERYIVVNIPDFRLRMVEGGKTVLGMKVVLGQPRAWQTPVLDSRINYLILNPKWHVPAGIFAKELIHHLRKDSTYLKRHNMVAIASTGGAVDPSTVDWTQVSASNPGYSIVQREGGGNSLGRIKFMFPNPYDVYLHDTPQKKLFARDMRALSHGCVRVENPLDLATYVMKDDPQWTRDRIESAIASGHNRSVPLPQPLDVHIIYLTAWVDENGVPNFRKDVYGKDAAFSRQMGL